MTPLEPATRAGRKKSDFPANAAKDSFGRLEVILCSFPTFPQVSFTPTILGWAFASLMTVSEEMSIPPVTPGKL